MAGYGERERGREHDGQGVKEAHIEVVGHIGYGIWKILGVLHPLL